MGRCGLSAHTTALGAQCKGWTTYGWPVTMPWIGAAEDLPRLVADIDAQVDAAQVDGDAERMRLLQQCTLCAAVRHAAARTQHVDHTADTLPVKALPSHILLHSLAYTNTAFAFQVPVPAWWCCVLC